MPAEMTYASLKSDVQVYLERGFTDADDPEVYEQIPKLITLGQYRIATELKILGEIEAVTSAFQSGVAVVDKPERWKETVSMNFGSGSGNNTRTTLLPRSYEYCTAYWPNRETTGTPLFYADYDAAHWLITPTPDDDYPFEVLYWQLPPLLDDTTQTNWYTANTPQMLLYASLLEATPFLMQDERIPTWQAFFDRAKGAVNQEDLEKVTDRASNRRTA